MPTKYKYRFERWSPMNTYKGDPTLGTIRTVPQNYYVADVMKTGRLTFRGIESMTRRANKVAVRKWWKEYRAKGGR